MAQKIASHFIAVPVHTVPLSRNGAHAQEYSPVVPENASPGDYKIAPSDVLEITIYGEENLTRNQLVVHPDGKVLFPLIGGA